MVLNHDKFLKNKRDNYIEINKYKMKREMLRGLRVCTKKISINNETKWLSFL